MNYIKAYERLRPVFRLYDIMMILSIAYGIIITANKGDLSMKFVFIFAGLLVVRFLTMFVYLIKKRV